MSLDKSPNLDILNMDRKLISSSSLIITPYLNKIYNQSLKNHFVHPDFKKARVTPIFKDQEDSDINKPSDYRPISVIPHLGKILEKLVKDQLVKFLSDTHAISPDQSAYLKNHSTQSSLHRVIDDWYENLDDGEYTAVCIFDISKCFDTINHDLLLAKLQKYGIRGDAWKWFKSYLTGRKQAVRCKGRLSDFEDIKYGVPQGSILGPFLFLIFINDISNAAENNCVINLFADDLCTYTSGKNLETVRARMQCCVTKICDWYKLNRLKANPKKSKLMVIASNCRRRHITAETFKISYDSIIIPLVDHVKYLGLLITEDLSWSKHIKEHARKINWKIVNLKKLAKNGCPKSLLATIYKTYIQSRIDYGITIWGCTTDDNLQKIQRLQNRAARVIENDWEFVDNRGIDILRKLKFQNIKERRNYFLTKLIFESIHHHQPHYLCDRITLKSDIRHYGGYRGHQLDVQIPLRLGKKFENSLMFAGGRLWNALPTEVKDATSRFSFKARYHKHVLPHLA